MTDKKIDETTTKCVYCGASPVVYHYDTDMWYYYCSNYPKCCRFDKWTFLGTSQSLAKKQWEIANRPINRFYQKEKRKAKKNETDSE